jgi:hypothetical protein
LWSKSHSASGKSEEWWHTSVSRSTDSENKSKNLPLNYSYRRAEGRNNITFQGGNLDLSLASIELETVVKKLIDQ